MDFKEGLGKYKWNTGKEYRGEWKKNIMHGKGIFTWTDGRFYNGSYVLGLK